VTSRVEPSTVLTTFMPCFAAKTFALERHVALISGRSVGSGADSSGRV